MTIAELDGVLNAHAYLRVERPPSLWAPQSELEPFVRMLGELIVVGLLRNGNVLAELTLNVSNVVIEPAAAGPMPAGVFVAVTIRGRGRLVARSDVGAYDFERRTGVGASSRASGRSGLPLQPRARRRRGLGHGAAADEQRAVVERRPLTRRRGFEPALHVACLLDLQRDFRQLPLGDRTQPLDRGVVLRRRSEQHADLFGATGRDAARCRSPRACGSTARRTCDDRSTRGAGGSRPISS